MPITGLFYLPTSTSDSSPAQDIVHRLTATYDAIPLPSWSLSHRLFRETRSGKSEQQASPVRETQKTLSQRYLQFLSLSHMAPHTYVAITSTLAASQTRIGTPTPTNSNPSVVTGEAASIISIPAGAHTEEFVNLILSKLGPLWQQRQVLSIINGVAFEAGNFRVRVGELKQGHGGGAQTVRGGICEIELLSNDDQTMDQDLAMGETLIRGFWENFGIKSSREVFDVAGMAEGQVAIRQWCEILRLRT